MIKLFRSERLVGAPCTHNPLDEIVEVVEGNKGLTVTG
jgi:hypothetical protein